MAKINIEFDTVDKTLSVQFNGTPVADVREVFIGGGYGTDGEYGCSVTTKKRDEAEDLVTYTHMVARQKAVEDIARLFSR